MKKIPTLFKRDSNHLVRPDVTLNCLWVLDGEGIATCKYDGSCCAVIDGLLYKRRVLKDGAEPLNSYRWVDTDLNTKKSIFWAPVDPDDPADQWHRYAFQSATRWDDGTYELVGPKVQGNPEKYPFHTLLLHKAAEEFADVPRSFLGLKEWLKPLDIEGLVFTHADGRRAKIKKKDFGLKRNSEGG